jgi:predicted pyridoxine 5'-phosphate oxidase superfamily flavin-nucleotide-binding protein
VRLTDDMKRVVLEQRLGFVATVSPDGRPNLSPKGTTTVLDDEHLLFADIASPGTIANLATSPYVELNVVDPIRRKGYRFKGRAEVHRAGKAFEHGLDVLEQRGYTTPRDKIRAVVFVTVDEAAPLVSPVYSSGAQEVEIAAFWLEHHRNLNS